MYRVSSPFYALALAGLLDRELQFLAASGAAAPAPAPEPARQSEAPAWDSPTGWVPAEPAPGRVPNPAAAMLTRGAQAQHPLYRDAQPPQMQARDEGERAPRTYGEARAGLTGSAAEEALRSGIEAAR